MLVMSQMNEVTAPTSGSSQGWSPHLLTIVVLPILPSARELGCFLLLASHVKAMKDPAFLSRAGLALLSRLR